mmetsp:Transcript_95953/g.161234  ORF Transcript_95953/g.161234 Transcript_95953/m.161234 type:complete len:93 (-) Transcript_95953:342-620(-)
MLNSCFPLGQLCPAIAFVISQGTSHNPLGACAASVGNSGSGDQTPNPTRKRGWQGMYPNGEDSVARWSFLGKYHGDASFKLVPAFRTDYPFK